MMILLKSSLSSLSLSTLLPTQTFFFFDQAFKQGLHDLYNMFEEYTQLSIVKTKNSMISPMQFARAPRPTFYYSEDHFTEK